MVEIIRAGNLPGKATITRTCPNCHTEFKFRVEEAKYVSDQRDGDYYEIECPLQGCSQAIRTTAAGVIR